MKNKSPSNQPTLFYETVTGTKHFVFKFGFTRQCKSSATYIMVVNLLSMSYKNQQTVNILNDKILNVSNMWQNERLQHKHCLQVLQNNCKHNEYEK
jgi:hypothetical protein